MLAYLSCNDCDSPTGTSGALQLFENVTSEAPDASNGPPSLPDDNRVNSSSILSGRNKRNRELVSANSAEAKGKGTMKRCRRRRRGPGESSTSGKQSKPTRKAKSYEELIDGKSVAESVKVLSFNRSNRQKDNQFLGSLKQIKTQWPMRFDIPVRSDIQIIKHNIKKNRGRVQEQAFNRS
ncbi:hypothetical protein V6N12_023163 [Hibiscus sabdariffa]|uniref:Uncharacterized protein n=1 Tax=Hibiscus sabdariffa TaxID=183260 RepID=A0ABR2FWW3_9ROSI